MLKRPSPMKQQAHLGQRPAAGVLGHREEVGQHLGRVPLVGEAVGRPARRRTRPAPRISPVPSRGNSIALNIRDSTRPVSGGGTPCARAGEEPGVQVGHVRTLVVRAPLNAHLVRVDVFSKMSAIVRPVNARFSSRARLARFRWPSPAGQARSRGDPRVDRPHDRAHLREDVHADQVCVRGRRVRPGCARDVLTPGSSQIGHKESAADTGRVLSRMFDAIEFRGKHRRRRGVAEFSDVPVYNGLTDEWHPTQMLADFLTMAEYAGGRPLTEVSYCFMGDGRFNMGRSLLVMGAIMGADVRICAPEDLWPDPEVQDAAVRGPRGPERGSRSRTTRRGAARRGLRAHRCVGVDGRAEGGLGRPCHRATPYQVNAAAMAMTGNPDAKLMHCLPAFHDTRTVVGPGRRAHRADRWSRGDRRGVLLTGHHRVRPGGEPPSHGEGPAGRDPRVRIAWVPARARVPRQVTGSGTLIIQRTP